MFAKDLIKVNQCCLHGRNRGKINEIVDAGKVLNQKRNHESFSPQVARVLHLWFCEMRSKPHAPPINQSLLVQKAILWVFLSSSTCISFNLQYTVLHCIQISSTCIPFNSVTLHTKYLRCLRHAYRLIYYIQYITSLTWITILFLIFQLC